MNRIVVRDGQESLNFAMEDLIKYHGRFNLGGVALAFRIMQESIRRLSPNQIQIAMGLNSGPASVRVALGSLMPLRW